MTMEKEEREGSEREGKLAKRFCFWSLSDSLGVRFTRNATNARQNSESERSPMVATAVVKGHI